MITTSGPAARREEGEGEVWERLWGKGVGPVARNAASSGFKKVGLATAAMSGLFWNGYARARSSPATTAQPACELCSVGCSRTSVHDERAGSGLSQDDV